MSNWTLFSNHGHILVCLARDPDARLRDVAADVGITERAVQKIVRDLQDGGMVSVTKNGRRNRYRIHKRRSLRHDLEAHCTLSDLANIINKGARKEPVEAQTNPVREVRSIKPETTRSEPKKSEPKKSEPEKSVPNEPKSAKPGVSDTIKRQQGTLF